jgi:hypothetical protein
MNQEFKSPQEPISLQISYLRRTAIGAAILKVENLKFGARVSTVHISLSQLPEGATPSTTLNEDNGLEVKAVAYVNLSPPEAESGPCYKGTWGLQPAPAVGSRPDGSVDLSGLVENQRDGTWVRIPPPSPAMIASKNLEIYGPRALLPATLETRIRQIAEHWARFAPDGQVARWSNEAVMFLVDIFPAGLDRMAAMESSRLLDQQGLQWKPHDAAATKGPFWFPTVSMNIDLKTRLPPEGVEWLYSRVVTRMLRGGRADLDVVVLDEKGGLVATSTQVALVVDASRNMKGRENKATL